jgi:sortase (surface protein transpeptidase)
VTIPAIGVDSRTVDVGLEDDGSMEIPEDVATVGWYELGVAPGEDGSAVLAGHVDSRTQGRGAFFDLRALEVGDAAEVAHADGSTSRWEVTGRTSYPKDEAPLPELFRRGGEPQLTLITCGGDFDADARSYTDNVVVVLAPA